jgi:hypothetical protein
MIEQSGGGWEDYLEIFYAPSRVFARRGSNWAMPLLILVVVSAILVLGTKGLLGPLFEADSQRAMASRMQGLTPEQAEQAQKMSGKFAWFVPVVIIVMSAILPIVVGFFLWLMGKVVGAQQAFGAALMVSTFSFFPRTLAWLVMGLQAAVLPEDSLKSLSSVSLSAARFMDPATTKPGMMALGARLDLFVIWGTILLAIGLKVTGKIPMQKAAIAAFLVWLIGSLPPLFQLLRG